MASLFLRRTAARSSLSSQALFKKTNPIIAASSTSLLPSTIGNSRCQQYQQVATRSFLNFDPKENDRIREIQLDEASVGSKMKPFNLVDKYYPKTNNTRTLPVELAHGYFWMVSDLRVTDGKPTKSNDYLIPANLAQPFPDLLAGVTNLKGETIELPQFFLRKNRSEDETAQCTLVAVSCRDHGFKMLNSWTEPFQEVFQDEERVELVHLNITEGWVSSMVLSSIIKGMVKKNTPEEDHETTLLCFRKTLEGFRDSLRMHNVMSGYIFLLDGVGRIRFAGSGEATPEDIEKIISFAKELTPLVAKSKGRGKKKSKRIT